ncbi:hypothetical protein FRC17_010001 [Serendipita sp. 399]|nr:hypothetical protein FRC17_010001 [Serendipita sp. 399]
MASQQPSQAQSVQEPASHVIHSPLPSRPSPVQPARTLDELLSGIGPSDHGLESSQTPPPTQLLNQTYAAPQAPPPLSQPQQQSQERNNMDLLAILSNAAASASPASNSSSQPVSKPNPVQEQSNAGRMLLDSLLSSTAQPTAPPRATESDRGFQRADAQPGPPEPPVTQQQQAPRKTAFDFVSPLDAFQPSPVVPTSTIAPKRKETSESHPSSQNALPSAASPLHDVTSQNIEVASFDGQENGTTTVDATKRKSIDLLEQLTRAAPIPHQAISTMDSSYNNPPAPTFGVPSQMQTQGGQGVGGGYRPPLPQEPPLMQQQQRESPALLGQTPPSTSPGIMAPPMSGSNQARASPTFKGGRMGGGGKKDWKTKGTGGDFMKSRSPAGPQSFNLDLSLPLAATSASSERLHITPIALLKLESIYVPGCTIGVSHWIAYAMTKGRVRLIARANGARALLKLPPTFSPNSSIVDLVTSGNRLAGVTSDGGFVVWEVPPMVDDDIPSLLLVSVPPSPTNPYKSIKWHPSDPDVLALATTSEVHLINVQRLYHAHTGDSISQHILTTSDAEILPAIPGAIGVPPNRPDLNIAAFAFDPSHNALATISQEGTINLWSVGSQQPPSYQAQASYSQHLNYQEPQLLWSGKVSGEGAPSSLFFMDQSQGVIVGRKRNTIIQLVTPQSTNVQATVKFVFGNGVFGSANPTSNAHDDREFFAHLAYDPRIRCVWAASSHRASLMALRIAPPDLLAKPGVEAPLHFEQILDFPILHPTISLGILVSSDGNEVEEMERGSSGMDGSGGAVVPTGPGGEMSMALVAYVIHAGGVDQVLIGKQDLETASQAALVKLPIQSPVLPAQQPRQDSPSLIPPPAPPAAVAPPSNSNPSPANHPNGPREPKKPSAAHTWYDPTPQSVFPPPPPAAMPTLSPGRNFGPMDSNSPQRPRSPVSEVEGETPETAEASSSRPGEVGGGRKNRRGKKWGPGPTAFPPDRGNTSDVASGIATDASAGILREIQKVEDGIQSKLSTVIGKEFKDQQVRQALDMQIVRGIGESMNQTLPNEIERLLLRPDVSNHVARTFSSAVTPLIERHVKDSITRTLIPAYQESTTEMYDHLYREINEEILNLKKEIVTWQSEALKGQEALLREMELSIRNLTDQVKSLNSQRSVTPYHVQSHRSSPAPIPPHLRQQQGLGQIDKMASISSWQMSSGLKPDVPITSGVGAPLNLPPNFPPHPSLAPTVPQQTQYSAPQAGTSHTLQAPLPPIQAPQYRHDTPEDWEKIFLQAISNPDIRPLREVLAHCPADKVMPLNGPLLVGQSIVLSVIHKLAGCLADVETLDESISLLWWLTRASQVLDAHDRIIHDYLDKMLPGIQDGLFRAIPRFSNASPQYNRQLSDLLQTLVIKAHRQ